MKVRLRAKMLGVKDGSLGEALSFQRFVDGRILFRVHFYGVAGSFDLFADVLESV